MGVADNVRTAAPISGTSAGKTVFELQVEQHHHDEMYHREITRLPLHQRLNHMALHFAKYTGKAAAMTDAAAKLPIYVDTLIIALSTANILNIELWDIIGSENCAFLGLSGFGQFLASEMSEEMQNSSVLIRETAIAAGRMAAACEKIDHLEEIPFRAEIKSSVARLSRLAIAFIVNQGFEPAQIVRERLSAVKRRLKLHGRI